jgi:hypothetical protein
MTTNRHAGLDPASMNSVASNLPSAEFLDSGFRLNDG